jgi:hypothetical protein
MKRTLQEIKKGTHVTTKTIAEKAGLSISDVEALLIGGAASWSLANKVVDAFNELSRMQISVLDIAFTAPPSDYDLPLFYDLKRRYHFSNEKLAKLAGVDEAVILRMIRNEEVSRATAEQVLAALDQLISYECGLETVRVMLDSEEERNARKQKRGSTSVSENTDRV